MAARHKYHRQLARLLNALSPEAREHLNRRGLRPGLSMALPDPADLADPDRRNAACESVRRLCTMGGRVFHGRRRGSTGNRPPPRKRWLFSAVKKRRRNGESRLSSPGTREYSDILYAPALRMRPERHGPERELLMWLRVGWLEASGKMPPSSPDRHVDTPGPFTRLLKCVLQKCGCDDVSAVELISSVPIPKSKGNTHS